MTIIKQPKYQEVIGHFSTKIKMQDEIDFKEERCPKCHGTMVSLKEENHARIFCPNCERSSKYESFQKLNNKILGKNQGMNVEGPPRPMKEINPRKLIK